MMVTIFNEYGWKQWCGNTSMIEFIVLCTLMGLGIGADVGIATMLQARQLQQFNKACFWLVGVTLTHTLFPMLGYFLTYFSVQGMPLLTPMIGLLAFSLIAYFLRQEYINLKQHRADGLNKLPDSTSVHSILSWALILTVSWDALWSGPAKSAQVIGWSEWLIWTSFILVGIVVALCGLLGLYIGRKMNSVKLTSGKYLILGQWLQYSVIGYFALLAVLRYTFAFNVEAWKLLLVSSILVACILFPIRHFLSQSLVFFRPFVSLGKIKGPVHSK